MKMTSDSIQAFFREDPWDLIKAPCYPEGRRFHPRDDRCECNDVMLYEVTDDFPKPTQADVHAGIRAAVYDISVGALSGYRVDTTIEAVLSNG